MSGPGPSRPSTQSDMSAGRGLRPRRDGELDELARLAALACDTPFALVCITDEAHGPTLGTCDLSAENLPADWPLYTRVQQADESLLIEDLTAEPDLADTAPIASEPFLRACAGIRLAGADGITMGFLVVLDNCPRRFGDERVAALRTLARQITLTLAPGEGPDPSVAIADQSTSRESDGEALRLHLGNAPLAAVEWDRNFRLVRWSAEAERLFGWKPPEVLGCHYRDWDFVHPDDRALLDQEFQTLFDQKAAGNRVANRNLARDGSVLHCEWHNSIQYDNEGKVLSILSFVRDISERVRSEEERERLLDREKQARRDAEIAREEFRALFEAAPGAYIVLTPGDYEVAAVNRSYLELTMRTRDEVMGRGFFDLLAGFADPEEAEEVEGVLREAMVRVESSLEPDVLGVIRCSLRAPDGQGFVERFWSPIHTPVTDRNGRLLYIIQRVEDVTDYVRERPTDDPAHLSGKTDQQTLQRMEAEIVLRSRELQQVNQRLHRSQRIGRLGGWDMDLVEDRVRWDSETYRIFGVEASEFSGKLESFLEKIHPEDRKLFLDRKERLREGQRPGNLEFRIIRPNGEIRHLLEAVEVEHDWRGKPLQLNGIVQDITEQKEAELRLRESERLLRISNRIARMGAWSWDAATGASVWSDELCAILEVPAGTSPESEEEGLAFHAAGDRERIASAFYACARNGTPFDEEVEVITATGRPIQVRNTGEAERDPQGRIIGVHGAFQDITERKEREREVRSLATRLSNTLESINDAFFMVDRDWRFLYVNREAERIFGAPREEFLGRIVWESFPGAVGTEIETAYRDAMETGKARQFNSYYEPLDLWFEIRAYPSEEGLAVYFQDITERREYEARLAEQAELLDRASDAILVRGIDHDIRFWNRGAERLYGWNREDVLGASIRELLYEDPSEFDQACATVLEEGQWRGRIQQKHRSGQVLTVECHWTLMLDENGWPESILAINTDITGRLSLEEQLRQSHRLEAVGQLTGGVAHDFNNLLTIILGNADFLSEDLDEPETLDMVAMIRSAAQRGADLTRRLLTVARRQTLEPTPVQINAMLAELKPLLERTLAENISLRLVLAEGLPSSFLDSSELESALLNLCINARDAMPRGGEITIETALTSLGAEYAEEQELEAGNYIMVAVSDTGCGIPAELMARVLDPFFSTKEEGKGSGLGLSMVYGFVKQSGGHMEIASEAGVGTVVNLFFPVTDSDAEPASRERPDLAEEDLGGVEKILLVDDDMLVRRHTERQLRGLGYTVVTASDGPSALAVLEEQPDVELLLTDVVMPGGMYGPELARHAMDMNPGLHVLLMSGYARDLATGLDESIDLLQKPYQRSELARKVREAISGPLDRY